MATTNGSLKIMVTGLHNDPVCMCIHGSRDHTKRLNLSLLKKLWGFFFFHRFGPFLLAMTTECRDMNMHETWSCIN